MWFFDAAKVISKPKNEKKIQIFSHNNLLFNERFQTFAIITQMGKSK